MLSLVLLPALSEQQGRWNDLACFRSRLFLFSCTLESLRLRRDFGSSLQFCNPSAPPPDSLALLPVPRKLLALGFVLYHLPHPDSCFNGHSNLDPA